MSLYSETLAEQARMVRLKCLWRPWLCPDRQTAIEADVRMRENAGLVRWMRQRIQDRLKGYA